MQLRISASKPRGDARLSAVLCCSRKQIPTAGRAGTGIKRIGPAGHNNHALLYRRHQAFSADWGKAWEVNFIVPETRVKDEAKGAQ